MEVDDSVFSRYSLCYDFLNYVCESYRSYDYRKHYDNDIFDDFNFFKLDVDYNYEYLTKIGESFFVKARNEYELNKVESLRLILITTAVSYYSYWIIGDNLPSDKQYREFYSRVRQEISIGSCY